jgi:hypothetical protein
MGMFMPRKLLKSFPYRAIRFRQDIVYANMTIAKIDRNEKKHNVISQTGGQRLLQIAARLNRRDRNIVINEIKSRYRPTYLADRLARGISHPYTQRPRYCYTKNALWLLLRLKLLKEQDSFIPIISIDRLVENRNNPKSNDCTVCSRLF